MTVRQWYGHYSTLIRQCFSGVLNADGRAREGFARPSAFVLELTPLAERFGASERIPRKKVHDRGDTNITCATRLTGLVSGNRGRRLARHASGPIVLTYKGSGLFFAGLDELPTGASDATALWMGNYASADRGFNPPPVSGAAQEVVVTNFEFQPIQ